MNCRSTTLRARSSTAIPNKITAGIPCLWPCFDRYRREQDYGRHSGTVWPPIQGFWAEAVARQGRADLFARELLVLARNADRDGEFVEIYHPDTGLPYGVCKSARDKGSADGKRSGIRHGAPPRFSG